MNDRNSNNGEMSTDVSGNQIQDNNSFSGMSGHAGNVGLGNTGRGDGNESIATGNSSVGSADIHLLRQIARSGFLRNEVFNLTQSVGFNNFILCIILANTVVLSLETVDWINKGYGWYLTMLDQGFLGIYVLESILKLFSWRFSYFKSGWNNFDLIIVIVSIATWIAPFYLTTAISFNVKIFRLLRLFRAVKAIRSLRVIRTISFLRSLQVIISTVLKSIPAMGNIVLMSGLTLYLFAVIGTICYGEMDPLRFGNLGSTFFRLFQLMTMDHWSDIYKANEDQSWSLYYFVFFVILLETFVFLNLFIAVIVNNLQSARDRLYIKRKQKGQNMNEDFLEYTNESQSSISTKDSEESMLDDLVGADNGIDNYYPPNLPSRTKALLSNYFMLLASLELNQLMYQKQQKVLDDLVDLAKEK